MGGAAGAADTGRARGAATAIRRGGGRGAAAAAAWAGKVLWTARDVAAPD